jgi:hypothetical protein
MKKHFFTICLISALIISSFGLGFFAAASHSAAVGLPFGGRELFWIPCTCTVSNLWIYYLAATPSNFHGGALVYSPYITQLFSFYNVETPDVWHLGQYLPGVQSCYMYAVFGCYPLPAIGTEMQVGTSMTPS